MRFSCGYNGSSWISNFKGEKVVKEWNVELLDL